MSNYVELGSRTAQGALDITGFNVGNWTITFDPAALAISTGIQYFEIYKMIVHGAPGSTFDVFVDINEWDTNILGSQNSWDPIQPLKIQQGQTVYFYYSDPFGDGFQPRATLWLRYDVGTETLYGKG